MCTAINPLSYTWVSIMLMTQWNTCIPWACAFSFSPGCWKGFNVRSGWSGGLGRVLGTILDVLTQKKREGDKRKQTAKREREHGTVNHNTTPSWHVLSLLWPRHPSLQPLSTIFSVYSTPTPLPKDLPSPPPFSFSVLTTPPPPSREKRLTCIQQHLSGRRKWIKERRRPVDSQCLRCQEPKSLSANAWDCPRCRRGTKKRAKKK